MMTSRNREPPVFFKRLGAHFVKQAGPIDRYLAVLAKLQERLGLAKSVALHPEWGHRAVGKARKGAVEDILGIDSES
jgi:hypothetical protein